MKMNRHENIIDLLSEQAYIKTEELCQILNVSPATIRRDLADLEQMAQIKRIHGGAIICNPSKRNEPNEQTEQTDLFANEKVRIAKAAALLVKEGDTIFLDAGSTNLHIANQLNSHKNLTIVTNSIKIAYQFLNRKDLTVIICGGTLGEVNPESVVGPLAEKTISLFRSTFCFLGTSGINVKQGVTDPYLSAASIKKIMIENSNHVVMVTDHRKFGVINSAFVCSIEKINHIITDDRAPMNDIEYLSSKGISVTLV
ncbi:MAG: hypothetical protein JWN30_1927 [Bacilli bacterium]|nr:hypothetical protein [Bacilli bacterium]